MKTKSLYGLLMLFALAAFQTGCLNPDSGSESGTSVDIAPPPDPNTYVCDPLVNDPDGVVSVTNGVVGELSYLTPDMPRYNNLNDILANAVKVEDLVLYFNQIYVPTRPFDRGFVTEGGQQVLTVNGDDLYEYFAVTMRGKIQTSVTLPAGTYQFAILADDGARLRMDFGNGMEMVVNNDGLHPTKMGCADNYVTLNDGDQIPFELEYYQGPRYHIALVLMARPVNSSSPAESECGQQGNSRYFDSTQDPVTAQPAYNNLLARGWAPIKPESFRLPEEYIKNPCNEPAPVISGFNVGPLNQTDMTLNWQTDRASTSQVFYKLSTDSNYTAGPINATMVTSHSEQITGLTANTVYNVFVRSASSSGLSSDSAVLNVRTRR